MGNDLTKTVEITTKNFLEKISSIATEQNLRFEDYQRECVANAIRTIYPIVQNSQYTLNDFDQNNVFEVLNQVAFLELNPSATPRECYFQIRKNYDNKAKKWLPPTLEFGVEGAGNDVILKKFGEVQRIKSYIVYKDDEFTEGYEDGWDTKLPYYKRTFKTSIPLKAVYLLLRKDGSTDVVYGTLDDVKKSLLGNARNNGADEKLIRELDKHTVEQLLDPNGKWIDYKIKKTYSGNTYETPLFSPAYTSPVSKDNMIERKLRNHATRKYPKNFKTPYIQERYEKTFDEAYDRKDVVEATAEERVGNAQIEFDEKQGKQELETNTNKKRVEKPNENAGEELEVDKPQQEDVETEELKIDDEIIDVEEQVEQDEPEEEQQEEENSEMPNWFDN
jgi:hypothetical protein